MSIITITDDNVKERTVLVDDNDATVSIHVWYRCGGNKESTIILRRDELERIAEAVLKPKPAPASGPVTHEFVTSLDRKPGCCHVCGNRREAAVHAAGKAGEVASERA